MSAPAFLLGVALLLPPEAGVAVRVLAPPATTPAPPAAVFSLGSGASLWFVYDGVWAANLSAGRRMRARAPLDSVAGAEGVGLWVVSGRDLGYLVADAPAEAAFQPVAELPVLAPRLFPGEDGALYIAGREPEGKAYALWVLRPKTGLRKLLSSPERISAAAGDGARHFAALGALVGRVEGGAFLPLLLHAEGSVTALAYSPAFGLAYATAREAGLLDARGSAPFLRAARAQIAARDGGLYAFLPDSMTVLRLDGLSGLARHLENP